MLFVVSTRHQKIITCQTGIVELSGYLYCVLTRWLFNVRASSFCRQATLHHIPRQVFFIGSLMAFIAKRQHFSHRD